MNKSKKHRKAWWNGLSPEQQGTYIKKVQAKRAKYRETHSAIETDYPRYSKTDGSMQKHKRLIERKNPWMKTNIPD